MVNNDHWNVMIDDNDGDDNGYYDDDNCDDTDYL